MKSAQPLVPDAVYHVFNHAVGTENLFREDENYRYFLELAKNHLISICDVFAFALLPNHFHILLKIHSEDILIKNFELKYRKKIEFDELSKLISRQFSNMFNAYSKAYNKRFNRKGALFIDYFRRKEIDNHVYLKNIMHYIHYNPVLHELCNSVEEWEFTSYNIYISDKNTKLNKMILIDNFEGRQSFVNFNKKKPVIDNEEFGMY